jgi:hypothetical protein
MFHVVTALALGGALGHYSAIQMAPWPKVRAATGVVMVTLGVVLWVWHP